MEHTQASVPSSAQGKHRGTAEPQTTQSGDGCWDKGLHLAREVATTRRSLLPSELRGSLHPHTIGVRLCHGPSLMDVG